MAQADVEANRVRTTRSIERESGLLAVLLAMTAVSAGLLVWQCATTSAVRGPWIAVDRLSAALTFLVASVGSVAFRFSQRYLYGESRQARFLLQLFYTIVSAYVLMLASNLLLLFVAWSSTSLGLHGLLTYYRERTEALRPARKKFLISRLGDAVLIAAIFLIWRDYGTLDLQVFLERMALWDDRATRDVVALLIATAALTKSAQFPFHSWLPETMEAPTPVSALMHAGIINAGGALLLRFAPLIARVPAALFLLSFIGTLTLVVGLPAMWAQVKVKRTLAWSTVGQMGFMMVQCGLAAFPAALLHILGHGYYKAWSFLRSGEVPVAAGSHAPVSPHRTLLLAIVGILASIPAMALARQITDYSPLHSPGELALSIVVSLSIGQLWAVLLGPRASATRFAVVRIALATLFTIAGVLAAYALYRGANWFLQPVLGDLPARRDSVAWLTAALPVVSLLLLTVVHALLPVLGQTRVGRAFYVHALHGFYFGAVADRVVDRVWNLLSHSKKEAANA